MTNFIYPSAQQCKLSDELPPISAGDEVAVDHPEGRTGRISVCSLTSKELLGAFESHLSQIEEFVSLLHLSEQLAIVSVRHKAAGYTHDTYIPVVGSNFEKLKSIANRDNKLIINLKADGSDIEIIVESDLLPLQKCSLPVLNEVHSTTELFELIEIVEASDVDVIDLSTYRRCVILPDELIHWS